jgi:hypothetical protein
VNRLEGNLLSVSLLCGNLLVQVISSSIDASIGPRWFCFGPQTREVSLPSHCASSELDERFDMEWSNVVLPSLNGVVVAREHGVEPCNKAYILDRKLLSQNMGTRLTWTRNEKVGTFGVPRCAGGWWGRNKSATNQGPSAPKRAISAASAP